ncbi:MAG TPA: hypothetical protein DCM49_04755 [Lachnospiraceae bacterium]|nr:hypothetical protein [Lachnospiraceae bacterium]
MELLYRRYGSSFFLISQKNTLFYCETDPPEDAHAALRKTAKLLCGGVQSPVRSLKIEGWGVEVRLRTLFWKNRSLTGKKKAGKSCADKSDV